MKDRSNAFAYFTGPNDDWLIGTEHISLIELPELNYKGGMFSIGIFIFRIDFLINEQKEE